MLLIYSELEGINKLSLSEWKYSWSLNNMGLNCVGPLTHRFFCLNIVIVLAICGFHICGFNQLRLKTVFLICVWESRNSDGQIKL